MNSLDVIDDQNLFSFGKAANVEKSKLHMLSSGEDKSIVEGFLSRRGSEMALKHLCEKFGASLFEKLPKIWDCITEVLKPASPGGLISTDDQRMANISKDNDPQTLINNIQVFPCILFCIRHLCFFLYSQALFIANVNFNILHVRELNL